MFLQMYIKKFYQSTATSKDFTDTFDEFVKTLDQSKFNVAEKIDWQAWIYGSGELPIVQDFSTPIAAEAQSLASGYEQLGGGSSPNGFVHMREYSPITKLVFLD